MFVIFFKPTPFFLWFVCNASPPHFILLRLIPILSFVFLLQVSVEGSTSRLRIVSGINHVSPALSAPSHLWVLVSSQMATGSCAVIATATYRASLCSSPIPPSSLFFYFPAHRKVTRAIKGCLRSFLWKDLFLCKIFLLERAKLLHWLHEPQPSFFY